MKKLLLTVTLCLACAAAFAQGKVRLVNDSLHLVYWQQGATAGQGYLAGQGGITLTIELWAGTSSTALSRVAVTDFAQQASAGTWAGMNVALPSPNFPNGPTFFDIEIYDVAGGSYSNAVNAGLYFGTSGMFTANSSSVAAYFSLVQHISPAFSTWADGTVNLDTIVPGYRGAIGLQTIPEPTTIALAGLGGAALMIFRRRR
jgi:hypothetical protein